MVLEKRDMKITLGLAVLATVGAGVATYFYYRKSEKSIEEEKKQNMVNPPSKVTNIPDTKQNENQILKEKSTHEPEAKVKPVPKAKSEQPTQPVVHIELSEIFNNLQKPEEVKVKPVPKAKSEQPTQPVVHIENSEIFNNLQKPKEVKVANAQISVESNNNKIISFLKQKAAVEKSNANLSMNLIMGINEGLIELIASDYAKLMIESRENRRKVRSEDKLEQYSQIILISSQHTEDLLVQNMDYLLNELSIPMEKFEMSNSHWAQINPQFAILSMMILDKLKLSIPNLNKCVLATSLEILDYQLETYPTISIGSSLPDPMLGPMIKHIWMQDMIFEKYRLEEEDYINAPGLDQSPEYRNKAEKIAQMLQAESMQFGGDMMPEMF